MWWRAPRKEPIPDTETFEPKTSLLANTKKSLSLQPTSKLSKNELTFYSFLHTKKKTYFCLIVIAMKIDVNQAVCTIVMQYPCGWSEGSGIEKNTHTHISLQYRIWGNFCQHLHYSLACKYANENSARTFFFIIIVSTRRQTENWKHKIKKNEIEWRPSHDEWRLCVHVVQHIAVMQLGCVLDRRHITLGEHAIITVKWESGQKMYMCNFDNQR